MKKFEIGKIYCSVGYNGKPDLTDNQPNQEKMVSFMITLKVDENNVPQKMSGCLY